ncbi:GIY-YIG nuclease family protein [Candidatus Woesebacteria bacterium]|nr:GIY-YIG nuclease family protein [Candidatus Woesebacteria bacterium]
MNYVYILQSYKDDKLYIGSTNNLKKRLVEHNSGKSKSTKSRKPFKLLYYEAFITEEEAFKKEKFYKSGRGHEVIYNMLFKSLPR